MGTFAKLAQATYLLGLVFRHICELNHELNQHQQEGMQLNTSLEALLLALSLSEDNPNSPAMAVCSRYAYS